MAYNLTPKKMIQNPIERGTASCSHIVGHAYLYPSPETPRSDIPDATEPIIRKVKTQKPSVLPAMT